MKAAIWMTVALMMSAGEVHAQTSRKDALDNDPDLFAIVTPDDSLGDMTRRKWLTLWPIPGREYWAAWDCKNKACDTPQRVHERAVAKLIPRIISDPKAEAAPLVPRTDCK